MLLKVSICDDDIQTALQLETIIKNKFANGNMKPLVQKFNNITDLLEDSDFDILFLDIIFGNKKDGLEAIKRLRKHGVDSIVIFISSLQSFRVSKVGFDQNVFNYLTKPLNESEVLNMLEQAVQEIEKRKAVAPKICVRTKEGITNIATDQIIYIETEGRKRRIIGFQKEYLVTATLSDLIEKLPSDNFAYTHSGFIANFEHIDSYTAEHIIFVNGDNIPLSRTYKKQFFEAISSYIRKSSLGGD